MAITTNRRTNDIHPSSFIRMNPGHYCALCSDQHKLMGGEDLDYIRQNEQKALMLYLQWKDAETIGRFCGVEPVDLLEHAEAYCWDVYRGYDTRTMYAAILREVIPEILANPDLVPAKDALKVGRQLDVIEGREIGKADNSLFDDRAVHSMMTAIEEMLHQGHLLDQVLPMFEAQIPGITEIYKRKHGQAPQLLQPVDIEAAVARKEFPGE